MNRYAALLFAALFAGCATRPPLGPSTGPVQITGFDAAGHQTVTSYAGRTSAGSGMVNDTASNAVLVALAEKIKGNDYTFAEAVRSAVVQPDVALDSKIEDAHKAALQDAAQALAAGASGNYAKAIAEAASLGGQLIAARTARANGPKPDSGAISTRILSSGEGHALAATVGIRTFGETLQASKRASYQANLDSSTTDTTSAADWEAIAKTFEALKKPILPPAVAPVSPPIVFPPIDPAPVSTNAVETIFAPGLPQ